MIVVRRSAIEPQSRCAVVLMKFGPDRGPQVCGKGSGGDRDVEWRPPMKNFHDIAAIVVVSENLQNCYEKLAFSSVSRLIVGGNQVMRKSELYRLINDVHVAGLKTIRI